MVGQHDWVDIHHLRGVHSNHSYGQPTEQVPTSVECYHRSEVSQHGARSHEQLQQSSICLGGASSSTSPLESEGAARFRWSGPTQLDPTSFNQMSREKHRNSQTMMHALGDYRSLRLPLAQQQQSEKVMMPSASANFSSRRTERPAAHSQLQRQSSIQLGYHTLSSKDYRPHPIATIDQVTSDNIVDRGVDRITGLAARAGRNVALVVNPKLPDLRSGFAVTGGLQSMQARTYSMNEEAKYRAAEHRPRIAAGASRATHLSLGHESHNFSTDADNIGVFHTRRFDVSQEEVPTAGARPKVELTWTPFAPHKKVH
eukprot:TRINITY_DN106627_c0_g1_i1.p1 TRINITY_DN106627_c0_g1~~TRINITY_DN106627_c0_g1_i1.p1  ORF type:complete len:314 (-),score=25.20 TRINITY_DN106627_c0_g1_i1:13-954(-)